MRITYGNESGNVITTGFANYSRLVGNLYDSTDVITSVFTVRIDPLRLWQAGDVMAKHIMSLGIDLRRVLGRNDREYSRILKELYVYMFVKAYLHGRNFNDVSKDNEDTYIFRGFALLCHMIAKRRVSYDYYEGLDFSISLEISDADHEYNMEVIRENFGFIGTIDETNLSGTYTFVIPMYERIAANMVNYVTNVNNADKKDSESLEKVANRKSNALGVDMCTLAPADVSNYFTSTELPFSNGYYNDDHTKYSFISSPLLDVRNREMAYPRAVHLVLTRMGFTNCSSYCEVDCSNDFGKFAKYEARSITNLEIKYLPDSDLKTPGPLGEGKRKGPNPS